MWTYESRQEESEMLAPTFVRFSCCHLCILALSCASFNTLKWMMGFFIHHHSSFLLQVWRHPQAWHLRLKAGHKLKDQGQMKWGTKQKWEKLDKLTSQSALLTVSVCLARMCMWWRVDRMHVNHLRCLWSWTSWRWTRTRSCSGRRRPVGSSLRKMLKRRRTAGGSLTSLRCLSAVCWNSEGPSPTVKRETECVCVSCMPESLPSGS